MTETEFKKLMAKAKAMQSIERPDFWKGFQRGLRLTHNGDVTKEEREHRLNCDTGDGLIGYRTGFFYDKLDPENPSEFREMLGLTNKALADMIGEKPRTVENWMTGRLSKRGKILLKNLIP
jgi:plasmid maintenance system antidote protein VapI